MVIKTSFKLFPSIRGLESFSFQIVYCSEGWIERFLESWSSVILKQWLRGGRRDVVVFVVPEVGLERRRAIVRVPEVGLVYLRLF